MILTIGKFTVLYFKTSNRDNNKCECAWMCCKCFILNKLSIHYLNRRGSPCPAPLHSFWRTPQSQTSDCFLKNVALSLTDEWNFWHNVALTPCIYSRSQHLNPLPLHFVKLLMIHLTCFTFDIGRITCYRKIKPIMHFISMGIIYELYCCIWRSSICLGNILKRLYVRRFMC